MFPRNGETWEIGPDQSHRRFLKTMPYKIVLEENGVLTKWWGDASSTEMIQMQEQAHANPNFDTMRYSIHDFSECAHFAYNASNIEYSAAIDGAASSSNRHVKIAIVAANAEVMDLARKYMDSGFSPYPVRFFSSMEEARAWVM